MCRRTEARDTEAKSPSVHRFHLRGSFKYEANFNVIDFNNFSRIIEVIEGKMGIQKKGEGTSDFF